MDFNKKYEITYQLIPLSSGTGMRRRQGTPITVEFGVPHDTGNINSTDTGNIDWATRTLNDGWSWAHWFNDNDSITICIPCEDNPEKACHVNYGVTLDNERFGDDANDIAVGGEMCYFTDTEKTKESYKRYVWMWAYMGWKHNWMEKYGTISGRLMGHFQLQPYNRTDPMNAFDTIGITWEQFLIDVDNEYDECIEDDSVFVDSTMDFIWDGKVLKDIKGTLKDDSKFYLDTTDLLNKLGFSYKWSKEKGLEVFSKN